jgi:NitT/TauT family transport system ATP-binding protein
VFSGRPGKVKDIIPIDIERPRKLRLKREPRFHKIEDRIWSLIEDDVKGRMLTNTEPTGGMPGFEQ